MADNAAMPEAGYTARFVRAWMLANERKSGWLARKLDVSPATALRLIKGTAPWTVDGLMRFCEASGLTPHAVMGWGTDLPGQQDALDAAHFQQPTPQPIPQRHRAK